MKKEFNLDFIDIFDKENKNCLFQGENFRDGFAIFVNDDGVLQSKSYYDTFPTIENQIMTRGLLNQKFRQIFNRNQLFE